ncbi:MAG: aminoacyl-histidine dipeptidase [Melioribacteraceae bacterium]|nr:MAG: aminoacyl-histidine dipeptidase [Melioribacteraceae bacterium]
MSANIIEGLKPEIVWQRFYELTQVPRPSKKEEKAVEYVRNFAKERNLEFKEDDVHNIVIKVPATKGYENAPGVVLQGHVDMVCEKNKGTEHDFDNDPIKLKIDGEWITAEGTTLGADNGIGVAAALATVDDDSFVHGPLELLLTVDEETGLTGANNLQPGFVEGRILLNMDSEEDGAFYVGCSGGQDTNGFYNIAKQKTAAGLVPVEIMVDGLKGGHSGLDVAAGRGNALQILARYLKKIDGIEYYIAQINGGSKRNAIPREAEVIAYVDAANIPAMEKVAEETTTEVLLEYKVNDGGVKVKVTKVEASYSEVYTKNFTDTIINVLYAMPNGIMAMSPDIEGLVETSTNLATINEENGRLRIGTSQRSSIESAKMYLSDSVAAIFKLSGADEIMIGDGYPGWQPNMDSNLLKVSKEVFKGMRGNEAEIKAIHAGLECGILGDRYPGMDMISYGPTIQGAHSPDEMLKIADIEHFWNLTKGILEKIAKG